MIQTRAYAAQSPQSPLTPFQIHRREPGPQDVVIDIHYCGICHSDIHQARDEWGGSKFPMVPGHEIVGTVARVGAKVRKLKKGQWVGVGCMVDSCGKCRGCKEDLEQFCEKGAAWTYNSFEMDRSTPTQGGYSETIVVDQSFVLSISKKLDPVGAAPLLCAGITTYSPLKKFGIKKGSRVGVAGLGGLGHMAVKLAHAMGAHVTVFSTSASKEGPSKKLGAKRFILSKNPEAFESVTDLDLIIDTVSAPHALGPYLERLRREGVLVVVGVPTEASPLEVGPLIGGRKILTGSLIGGVRETQEMLDFCARKGVVSDIEIIPASQINEAYERTIRGDVRYRFVIDLKTL